MGVIRKHAAHSPILSDLKTIYQAADEQKDQAALDRVTEKWSPKYPNSMKRWKDNWDAVSPIFKFSIFHFFLWYFYVATSSGNARNAAPPAPQVRNCSAYPETL